MNHSTDPHAASSVHIQERRTFAPHGRARRTVALAVASALALTSTVGVAQEQTETPAQATPPAESAMIRLIRGLMESGALTRDVGEALLVQAQTEAMAAQRTQDQAATAAAAVAAPSGATALRPEPGDVRVPYISESVRDEIRADLKQEVLAQAKQEGWAAPNETPAWAKRIRFDSDVRVRSESRLFSESNSNIEIDWPQLNVGDGYDTNPNTNLALPPVANTREDRKNQWRVRARVGLFADLSERTQAAVRIATGDDNSPVSTNETMGGGLDKDDIWIDQVWLSHKVTDWLKLTGGRFTNPFVPSDMAFDSTDLVFDEDLNFDGAVIQFAQGVGPVRLLSNAGYIPLEYSSDSFPLRSQEKMESETKWLLAAQLGADWEITDRHRLRGTAAWYDFRNISGKVSEPCALYAGEQSCSTDWSRPAFMQKGNTLMALRDVALDPLDPAGTPTPQYVGLAAEFELLDVNLNWQARVGERFYLRVEADYVQNLAYDEDEMWERAAPDRIVNNFDGSGGTNRAAFKSGDSAYLVRATFGAPTLDAPGDWNMQVGYKRIEPDALPDAYNDSDFHLGGTNARGYFVGGSYAFDKRAWFTGRWIATKELYGAPLSIDTLQLDVNARF
ncbi:putative porin [Steroidobacter sp. S1-65]|uniref:Porin n=1 Tax=Steroidobacter gossypii TaxID=2805490 RepID=A0ABS1WZJ8_9GAMM|nr:putative porin [Steroidobacter gossypii]MBM0106362.1 putative porin [Steroidobacter gossypii]